MNEIAPQPPTRAEVSILKTRVDSLEDTVAYLRDRVRYLEERAIKSPPKERG